MLYTWNTKYWMSTVIDKSIYESVHDTNYNFSTGFSNDNPPLLKINYKELNPLCP